MIIYVDASFLVSAYSVDANSESALKVMSVLQEALWVTTFAQLEFVNALSLRVFRDEISASQAKSSQRAFDQDMRSGVLQLKLLPDHVFERANLIAHQTTSQLGTRTPDLLHVAAALELDIKTILTFDRQQAKLAHRVGLKTIPNL